MHTVKTVAALRAAVAQARAGHAGRVALIPTMGNLHEGHLALIREAARHADFRVASVFVNPLQFGPGGDFDRYPRTLERDIDVLEGEGVNLLYAPSVEQMYPQGECLARVAVQGLSDVLCGAHRPGHFEGVTTVVSLLLNQVQPDVAVFGCKDYQQLVVIRRMVADLHFPVEVVGAETVRAHDGLAMSSRNQYLNADERARAPRLQQALQQAAKRLRDGECNYAGLERQGMQALTAAGMQPDYFAIRGLDLSSPDEHGKALIVLAAARLGRARLIDNIRIER